LETPKEAETELLWSMQSGKYLHQLTRWRELDIEREIFCQDIDEKLYIHGRLDMYDYKTQTIIDLKTTNAIKWQYTNHLIPRERDISIVVLWFFIWFENWGIKFDVAICGLEESDFI
jgi:hypothetical protein